MRMRYKVFTIKNEQLTESGQIKKQNKGQKHNDREHARAKLKVIGNIIRSNYIIRGRRSLQRGTSDTNELE